MQDQQATFKQTQVLFYALLAGQLMICLVLLLISSKSHINPSLDMSFGDIKQLLMILLVPAAIMGSHYLYSNKSREGKQLKGFEEKLMHFRASSILRWALLEGVNLITLIFFFLTKNYFFLLIFGFGFLIFFFTRPTENGFTEDYKLNSQEKQDFKEDLKKGFQKQ